MANAALEHPDPVEPEPESNESVLAEGPPAHGLFVDHLCHAYGSRRVVEDVAFGLAAGEVHCLVGPSGCGKTTILRLIAGLEPLQGGRVVIDRQVVAEPGRSIPTENRRIGLMFQDFALFPHLSILDNVAFGLADLDRRERRRRAGDLLAQLDLSGHLDAYPHMLSGGEQQRAALARALAPRPCLMLLDEPFSSLDATLREHVRDDTISLLRAEGTPVLMVTHDAEEAVRVADRIHVMLEGRILQSGTPAELYSHPASPFVAGFFGPPNRFKGWVLAGEVSTPLGPMKVRDLADGTAVDVLIRPEGLHPTKQLNGECPRFDVHRIRDLGTNRVLELKLSDGPVLTVRMTSYADFEAGDTVTVDVDPGQVHIYPAEGHTG
ncbi:MAG: ABC transporter ATP-binding protein [Alphaproteobacteria bacterium]|nr:ABC transporter ATP-binding protein [Alphaproteobacteria bacterium]